jgi:hypothetical protein
MIEQSEAGDLRGPLWPQARVPPGLYAIPAATFCFVERSIRRMDEREAIDVLPCVSLEGRDTD